MVWYPVVRTDDVPEGEAVRVTVEGEPLALFNIDGIFYATHDVCTHAHASLSDGYVNGDCVECPLHEGVFHIPTGHIVSGPVRVSVRIYPVKIEGQQVLVQVS